MRLNVNGQTHEVDAAEDMPLLWAIRDLVGLKGTKFGCGAGLCGACTVHVDGVAVRSCQTLAADAEGTQITTIEGLDPAGEHPLQKAWVDLQVPQCGYCQSGQIMQAAQLLADNPKPSRDDIVAHMGGNLCRCMTYDRIVDAIEAASA